MRRFDAQVDADGDKTVRQWWYIARRDVERLRRVFRIGKVDKM